jgi:RNA polymerase sigma factor (sigma-70 family)
MMEPGCPSPNQTEEALLLEVRTRARAVAGRLFRNRSVADDVAQEAALDCLTRLRDGTWTVPPEALEAYVTCFVLRRRTDRRRRRAAGAERDAAHLRELEATPHAWMEPGVGTGEEQEKELAALYHATLKSMPEVTRRVFLLVRETGESYNGVSELLGMSPKSVGSHMVRALGIFREALRAKGIAVPPEKQPRFSDGGRRPGAKGKARPARPEENVVEPPTAEELAELADYAAIRRTIAVLRAEIRRQLGYDDDFDEFLYGGRLLAGYEVESFRQENGAPSRRIGAL